MKDDNEMLWDAIREIGERLSTLNQAIKNIHQKIESLESAKEEPEEKEEYLKSLTYHWQPISFKPKDRMHCLISWWEGNSYSSSIKGFYMPDRDQFFSTINDFSFPIHADLWLEIPELPSERVHP